MFRLGCRSIKIEFDFFECIVLADNLSLGDDITQSLIIGGVFDQQVTHQPTEKVIERIANPTEKRVPGVGLPAIHGDDF